MAFFPFLPELSDKYKIMTISHIQSKLSFTCICREWECLGENGIQDSNNTMDTGCSYVL